MVRSRFSTEHLTLTRIDRLDSELHLSSTSYNIFILIIMLRKIGLERFNILGIKQQARQTIL